MAWSPPLRRGGVIVVVLALLASSQLALKTASANAGACVFPIGPCATELEQEIGQDAAAVIDTAQQCLDQAPGPGNICGNYLALARSLVATAATLTFDCIDNYYGSPCRLAWDGIQSAENGILTCIGLWPGTLCGNYYWFASDLLWSEYAYVLATYGACTTGNNAYCNEIYSLYQDALHGVSNCVGMTPGTLCPSMIQFALQEVAVVEGLAFQELGTVENVASNSVYVGVAPVPNDPTDLVVDPAQYAAKVTDMEQQSAAIDQDLAIYAAQPAPAESEVPPPTGDAAPPRAKVAVTGYPQGSHNWCVPASTATAISAFGSSPSVATLAAEQGSSDEVDPKTGVAKGTPLTEAAKSLRRRVSRIYYLFDHAYTPADLIHKVSADIGKYSAPVIVSAYTPDLDWWMSSPTQGYHALTIYLYHTSSGGGFKVYDPAYNDRFGISLAKMSKANYDDQAQLVW